jgi:hypothetical protein
MRYYIRTTLALLLLASVAIAGRVRRDPLTEAETDQLREAAQDPGPRLKLYIKFAAARLETIQQLRTDPKMAAERGQRIHDLLEDFVNVVDEIDRNVDTYEEHDVDLRKPLKELIEADTGWQLRLRTLKEAPHSDSVAASEFREYSFTLETALDSVSSSADDARKILQEQEAHPKKKK